MKSEIDYLIIGQGIAGTLLAHFLLKAGQRIHVLGPDDQGSASRVAAGIINPITGRRFIKSWRIDELLPFARKTYREIEQKFGISVYHERRLIRSIFSVEEENDWLSRTGDPAYADYLEEEAELGNFEGRIQPALAYGGVRQAAQVDLGAICGAYRDLFLREKILTEGKLHYEDLELTDSGVRYRDTEAKQVVFCEGYRAAGNPFFSYLPFKGDKGDVLLIKAPQAAFTGIIKHKVFIVPLKDDIYWTGSTYISRFENESPLPEGREKLLARLRETLAIPFEVVAHRAAVRPTVRDRRPLLGRHPEFPRLSLFNGLGTKGASLGPFFARQMAGFLTLNLPLDAETDIQRFRQ